MSKRKLAICVIVADVAENGKAGKASIRAYIEAKMSRKTFDEAILLGKKLYNKKEN